MSVDRRFRSAPLTQPLIYPDCSVYFEWLTQYLEWWSFAGDLTEIRTPATAVKGQCLSHLTIRPNKEDMTVSSFIVNNSKLTQTQSNPELIQNYYNFLNCYYLNWGERNLEFPCALPSPLFGIYHTNWTEIMTKSVDCVLRHISISFVIWTKVFCYRQGLV